MSLDSGRSALARSCRSVLLLSKNELINPTVKCSVASVVSDFTVVAAGTFFPNSASMALQVFSRLSRIAIVSGDSFSPSPRDNCLAFSTCSETPDVSIQRLPTSGHSPPGAPELLTTDLSSVRAVPTEIGEGALHVSVHSKAPGECRGTSCQQN